MSGAVDIQNEWTTHGSTAADILKVEPNKKEYAYARIDRDTLYPKIRDTTLALKDLRHQVGQGFVLGLVNGSPMVNNPAEAVKLENQFMTLAAKLPEKFDNKFSENDSYNLAEALDQLLGLQKALGGSPKNADVLEKLNENVNIILDQRKPDDERAQAKTSIEATYNDKFMQGMLQHARDMNHKLTEGRKELKSLQYAKDRGCRNLMQLATGTWPQNRDQDNYFKAFTDQRNPNDNVDVQQEGVQACFGTMVGLGRDPSGGLVVGLRAQDIGNIQAGTAMAIVLACESTTPQKPIRLRGDCPGAYEALLRLMKANEPDSPLMHNGKPRSIQANLTGKAKRIRQKPNSSEARKAFLEMCTQNMFHVNLLGKGNEKALADVLSRWANNVTETSEKDQAKRQKLQDISTTLSNLDKHLGREGLDTKIQQLETISQDKNKSEAERAEASHLLENLKDVQAIQQGQSISYSDAKGKTHSLTINKDCLKNLSTTDLKDIAYGDAAPETNALMRACDLGISGAAARYQQRMDNNKAKREADKTPTVKAADTGSRNAPPRPGK